MIKSKPIIPSNLKNGSAGGELPPANYHAAIAQRNALNESACHSYDGSVENLTGVSPLHRGSDPSMLYFLTSRTLEMTLGNEKGSVGLYADT